jgi:hypothetical protein
MSRLDELMGPDYRRFRVFFALDGFDCTSGIIALHKDVINAVDDEWRSHFYDFWNPEEIASHIAYNMCIYNDDLSRLDGFANHPREYAAMLEWPTLGEWDVSAKEIEQQ